MSCVFKQVLVSVDQYGNRVVSWSMDPDQNYPDNFVLRIEYARAGGPWETLEDNIQGTCLYIDRRKMNFNKYLNDYYRLVLTVPGEDGEPVETYVSEAVEAGRAHSYPFSAEANNLIRLALLEIKEGGRTGILLKKKEWGERCPHCTDFKDENSVNEQCRYCLGTGILGGYYRGIPYDILVQSFSDAMKVAVSGYEQQNQITAKGIAWPWLHLGDVWVDNLNNERYYINNVAVLSAYKNIPLIYGLSMSRLELTDVMFSDTANELASTPHNWENDLSKF